MAVSTSAEPREQIGAKEVGETTCCVVGGGPAGAMLALLLARQGVEVTLLEAHRDFERMHWICFHIVFEHMGAEPHEPCEDPSCPWAVMRAYEEELRRLGRDPGEVLERSWGLGRGT
jgi:choline dehydrogenase-like flavoprotein